MAAQMFDLADGVTGTVGASIPRVVPQRGLTVVIRNNTSVIFSEGASYMPQGRSGEFVLPNVPPSCNVVLRYGPRVVRPSGIKGATKFAVGPHGKIIVGFDVQDAYGRSHARNNFDVKGYDSGRPLERIVRDCDLGGGKWLWHDQGRRHVQRSLPIESFGIAGGFRVDVYMSESGTSCVLEVTISQQGWGS